MHLAPHRMDFYDINEDGILDDPELRMLLTDAIVTAAFTDCDTNKSRGLTSQEGYDCNLKVSYFFYNPRICA